MATWAVIGVESSVAWPTKDTEVAFRGHTLILRPATEQHLASVAFEHPASMTLDDALLLIRHYLSSLSWVEQAGIKEVAATGGSAPFYLGRGPRWGVVTEHFKHDYLPDPAEPRTRLALGLYREGMSSESAPYRFLSFFKVINILHAKGPHQIAWINGNLQHIRDARANERIRELTGQVPDVGAYLYESGRCAVAHAFSQPLIDPESIADGRRLSADLPVMQALAEVLVERELDVKSTDTIWREHLYHLDGVRELLGPELVARLKAKERVQAADIPPFPALTIQVRDKPSLDSFAALRPTCIAVDEGTIWLRCDSPKGTAQVLLGLAVADEYLVFDPQEHVAVSPEQAVPALEAQRDQVTLLRNLLLNGQLEILETASGRRLGRTDAYMGENIDLRTTLQNLDHIAARLEESIKQAQFSTGAQES